MSGTIHLTPEQQTALRNASNLREAGFHDAAKWLEDSVWNAHVGRFYMGDEDETSHHWPTPEELRNLRAKPPSTP